MRPIPYFFQTISQQELLPLLRPLDNRMSLQLKTLHIRFCIAQHAHWRSINFRIGAPLERTLGGRALATALGHRYMQLRTLDPLFGIGQPLPHRLPQPHKPSKQLGKHSDGSAGCLALCGHIDLKT